MSDKCYLYCFLKQKYGANGWEYDFVHLHSTFHATLGDLEAYSGDSPYVSGAEFLCGGLVVDGGFRLMVAGDWVDSSVTKGDYIYVIVIERYDDWEMNWKFSGVRFALSADEMLQLVQDHLMDGNARIHQGLIEAEYSDGMCCRFHFMGNTLQ